MNNSFTHFKPGNLRRFMLLVFFHCFLSCVVFAQVSTYTCDFEDESENLLWTRNSGVFGESCANRWYIDTAVNNGGRHSLYISNDGGLNAGYVRSSLVVISYRTLTLKPGDYELALDWQAGASRSSGFYVCWIPDTVAGINSNINGFLPKWVERYAVDFGDSIWLSSSNWNSVSDTIRSDGTPHKLAFVWNNRVEEPALPGACIDNIDIFPVTQCEKPHDITIAASGEKVIISWQAEADSYDLRFRSSTDGIWHEHNGLTAPEFVSDDAGEGVIDVYVRSRCGDEHSAWASTNKFIFLTGSRCIDYLDINDNNCYWGNVLDPSAYQSAMNFGPLSKKSRHTIHYDQNEYDPRTQNLLKTVPDGELASVRLGNWDINAQAEVIEYKYAVDASSARILLLKYAVVLEDPGHKKEEQPRFTLSILKDGKPISDYGCGEADFSAGYDTEDWNVASNDSIDVLWKDWSTIGINLEQFDKDTLTIRLSTYDCTETGHYGYAYFTLSCSNGELQGLGCGDTPTTSFTGPDGFKYAWYLPEKPDEILGTEQTFPVMPNDTMTYLCNVIQPTNENCYYTLSATAKPRWPVADAGYDAVVRDCKNIVQFTDKSYIKLVNQTSKDTVVLDKRCETAFWDFGDGTTSDVANPQHEFPARGGQYTVTFTAGLSGGACTSDCTFTVDLPELSEEPDTIKAFTCKGSPYYFHGLPWYSTGFYCDTTVDQITGCRTIEVLDLTAVQPFDTTVYDTVCSANLPYIFHGQECTATGEYTASLENIHKCDSTITLSLYVNTSLELAIANQVSVCSDDGEIRIPFEVTSGEVTKYSLEFEGQDPEANVTGANPVDNTIVVPMPTGLRPGIYRTNLTFSNMDCGDYTQTVDIDLRYSKETVTQRWNDVLGVHNSDNNGGYTFNAYQWYENGQPLPGETQSILYRPGGLQPGAQYCVELTRTDDGVKAFTCGIEAQDMPDVTATPTVVFADAEVVVNTDAAGVARLYSASGQIVGTFDIGCGFTNLQLDAAPGSYFLQIILENGSCKTEKITIKR